MCFFAGGIPSAFVIFGGAGLKLCKRDKKYKRTIAKSGSVKYNKGQSMMDDYADTCRERSVNLYMG